MEAIIPNRQVFPSSLFPLRGDISAEAGATSVIVQGLQGIPIIAPPVEPVGLDTFFYDSYNNDWFYASPWDIPVGIPLVWEGYGYGSSGISWIAPDTLAFGNGTDGDVSGAAAMTALVLFGSASYYGPYNDYDVDYGPSYDQFYTSIFSGATQNWNLILPPNPGTSGQVLTTNGTGVTYWSTISGGGGGSVTSFSSGSLSPLFTTSVATPTTTPALSFSLNTQNANTVFAGPVSGGAATPTFRALVSTDIPVPGSTGDVLYNNGGVLGAALTTITAAGSITLPDTQTITWTGSAYSSVGLSQLAADTLAVGNGTESDVSGGMAMTALILYGSSYYSAYDAFHTTIYSGATQNWNLVLPETAGVNGQVLVNIGSGFTEWESVSTLGVPWSALTGDLTETQVIPWDGGTVGTPDTGISRISAGVLGIGTGAQGSSNGTIVAASGAIASQIAGTLGTQLGTPSTPTITFVGTTSGSPTWSYKLVAYDQFGFETLPSTAGTITSSNTTLSSSNYNVITAPSTLPLGCVGWNVYRTAVATSPTTTGIIGQITTAGGTLNDKALPGDGSTVPLWNFTGLITSAASAGAGSCGLLTPFHEATLMIADTTVVFVGNSTINQLKAIQCYCARTVTVNRMTLYVVQNESGATANIAIYRGDGGRKLFDVNVSVASTGIVTSTSTGVTGFSFPFTFYAGQTYYIVSSSSNASASAYGASMNGYATIQQNLVSAVHVRYGYCANSTAAGVAPATLGTITYQGASSFPIACYWEP